MPLLQIRDLPEDLYRKLVRSAEQERRSISQEAVATIAKGLGTVIDAKSQRRDALRRAAALNRERTKLLLDPVKLVREDRNR